MKDVPPKVSHYCYGPRELNVALTRLRLNSAPLNGYLYRIGVCDSPQCICGHGEESVHHFFSLVKGMPLT